MPIFGFSSELNTQIPPKNDTTSKTDQAKDVKVVNEVDLLPVILEGMHVEPFKLNANIKFTNIHLGWSHETYA